MDWKSREITHHYNLRSLKGPRLRSRTRDLRNYTDASSSNSHSQSPYQDNRNTSQQQRRRGRPRNEENQGIDGSQRGHRRDRSQHSRDRHQQRRRMNSTRRAHLPGIPTSTSNKPDDASDDIKCVICIDTVNDTEMKYVRCGHSFHKKCCDNWLKVNNICPICRTVVAPRRICESIREDTPISDIIYFFALNVTYDYIT